MGFRISYFLAAKWFDVVAKLPTSMNRFTAAEKEVVACLAIGMSNRAIAIRVFRSEAGVKVMVWKIYTKLGLSNRTEISPRVKVANMMRIGK